MSQNRTETTNTAKFPKLTEGMDTKAIMRSLYKKFNNLKEGAIDEKALDSFVVVDAKTLHAKNLATTVGRFGRDERAIDKNLEMLGQGIGTVDKSQQRSLMDQMDGFKSKLEGLKNKGQELANRSKNFLQQHQKLVTDQHEILAEFIQSHPKGNYTKEDLDRLVTTLTNRVGKFVDAFQESVKQFAEDQEKHMADLDDLKTQTANAIPAGFRAKMAAAGIEPAKASTTKQSR